MIVKLLVDTGNLHKGDKVAVYFTNQESSCDEEKFTAMVMINGNLNNIWPLFEREYKELPQDKYPELYL